MGRRKTQFDESALFNNSTYIQYYNRLKELSISMFEWKNLPDTIDVRFLETTLFENGMCVFFEDEVMGFLALPCATMGRFNVYNIPTKRRAYASNNYNKRLTGKDSVIIYNNFLRTNSVLDVEMFSRRLANLDRTIDINVNAQKTPILIQCEESQRLTMKNLYKEYDGNQPVIYADKGLNPKGLDVFKTDAPYISDKLYELKVQIWNEALTYLGISNVNIIKRERMITDEVQRNQGGVVASRYSRLEARRQACEQINAMFGLNITVDYREDYQVYDEQDGDGEMIGGGRNE